MKPYIIYRSYIGQERAHLSYDDKGKLFDLRNKGEPRNIYVIDISE